MLFEKTILNAYKSNMFKRYDDNGTAFYFSAEDFKGLNKSPYSFKTDKGNQLQGYFYFYDNPTVNQLVVFDHGMGGGHRAYMREIELIASKGYLVFAYDHTGCMESEGESVCGFATSVADLDCALKTLKNDEKYSGFKISVIGHSWGAYSTQNVVALHSDIANIVAISGPVSAGALINQSFGGILKPFRKSVMKLELDSNPDYANLDAVTALKKFNGNALIIHSANDKIVKKQCHFDVLYENLKDKPNVSFLLTENKLHNPNYTKEAVEYLNVYLSLLGEKTKKGLLKTAEQKKEFLDGFDWYKMTQQDMAVWEEIFKTLEK